MNHFNPLIYDQLFLKKQPELNNQFKVQNFEAQEWPKDVKLTELSQCFKTLEKFIKTSLNWSFSECSDEELTTIEENLTNLLTFLQVEKQYASHFWKVDPRRVQASIVHLYRFLQMLVKAIIPDPNMSLYQCKTAKKLCTNLSKLQKVMNTILKALKPIYHFLQSELFHEQLHLTHSFVNNWVYFMKKLPTLKADKMDHTPELLKYIILLNKVSVSGSKGNLQQVKGFVCEKKQSLETQCDDECIISNCSSTQQDKSQKKKNVIAQESQNKEKLTPERKQKYQPIKFKFPEHISNSSIRFKHNTSYHLKNNEGSNSIEPPVLKKKHSIQLSKTAFNSQTLCRSRSRNQTITPKGRSQTQKSVQQKVPSAQQQNKKGARATKAPTQEPDEERIAIRTVNRQNAKQMSPSKKKVQQQGCVVKADLEIEAKKVFQKERYKLSNIDTNSGAKISRGWQVIRDYVNKRIVKRKLQKLVGISFEKQFNQQFKSMA